MEKQSKTKEEKTQNAKQTAAEKYEENRRHVAALLDWIGCELESHAEQAKKDPKNWGYAGDLGAVQERLKDILGHLTGFDDKDIDETLADMEATKAFKQRQHRRS